MLTQCGCGTVHEPGCPHYEPPGDIFDNPTPTPKQKGWVCPACGKGNAPWKGQCDCPGDVELGGGCTTQPWSPS